MEKQGKTQRTWIRGSCIGRGANGTVNLGVQISDGRLFAVKSIDLSSALPSQVAALENEIAVLKSLSSPFIVKYLGDDTTAEGPTSFRNLHMEYLPNGTVSDVANSTNCDENSIAGYIWCLVSALSYLHSKGITHCDVKGKNVLLGNSPGSARLADFGSSGGGGGGGSPLWMAPEVIRREYQGPESDVWSLGCTVIEMATAAPPWEATANSVYRIGYSDELPQFPAGFSPLGIDFLEKCLKRDYAKRWSCDQLLQHPFLTMRSQGNIHIPDHSSPRGVLEWFDSDSHDEEEEQGITDLGADGRIRELACKAGANWEFDDGWVVVRGFSEYSDLNEGIFGMEYAAPTGSMNSNVNLVLQERGYSTVNDDAQEYNEAEHFYVGCTNINMPPSTGLRVNRLYGFSIFSFVCIRFVHIFSQFLNFISINYDSRDNLSLLSNLNLIFSRCQLCL